MSIGLMISALLLLLLVLVLLLVALPLIGASDAAEKRAWENGASQVFQVNWGRANDAAEIAQRDGVDELTGLLDSGVAE